MFARSEWLLNGCLKSGETWHGLHGTVAQNLHQLVWTLRAGLPKQRKERCLLSSGTYGDVRRPSVPAPLLVYCLLYSGVLSRDDDTVILYFEFSFCFKSSNLSIGLCLPPFYCPPWWSQEDRASAVSSYLCSIQVITS